MWPPWLLLLPWGRDLSFIGDLLNEGGDGGGDDGGDDDGGGDGDGDGDADADQIYIIGMYESPFLVCG